MRRQPPVYSPVPWSALAAGVSASLGGDADHGVERRIAGLLERRYEALGCLLTDSGTTALRLAIQGSLADSARPVALPGFSCYDLATAVLGAGARAVLYDLDPDTLGPDAESLAALRTMDPGALVLAPLYGYPCDVSHAADLVPDAVVIVDAAQSVGAELGGRPVAALGSVSVLSFGRGKGMTGGEGGAVLAHDERGLAVLGRAGALLAGAKAKSGLKSLAALTAQVVLGRPSLYGIPAALPFLHLGESLYHPPWPPAPCAAGPLAALEKVMPAADGEVEARSRNAERLLESLRLAKHLRPVASATSARPGYLRLPAVVHGTSRQDLISGVARRLGVTPGYPTALADLPAMASALVGSRPALGGSLTLARSLLTLPTHSLLEEADLVALEQWLRRA